MEVGVWNQEDHPSPTWETGCGTLVAAEDTWHQSIKEDKDKMEERPDLVWFEDSETTSI